jgi:DUF4097 and DUF4098 domain-containing protein YvlB
MFGLRKAVIAGVLATVAGGTGLHATIIGVPRPEFRHLYPLHPAGRVQIQNLYGDVRITAWDRDQVLVEAFKKSADPKRLDDAQIVVDSCYDSLSIRTAYAGSDAEHPASVEYRIMVPRGVKLQNVKLINGGLSISGVAGAVKASSVNGSIKVEGLLGEADLSTVNGKLEADFGRVIDSGLISLSSVNGAIKLSIPQSSEATLAADNRSGGIESEFGRVWRESNGHRLRAVMNRGGVQIQLHNVNGGISVRSNPGRRTERPWS